MYLLLNINNGTLFFVKFTQNIYAYSTQEPKNENDLSKHRTKIVLM